MNRKLTVLAAGLIAACALFTGCAGKSSEKAPAAEETAAAQETAAAEDAGNDWYVEYLSDDSVKEQYPFCKYVDVNGDGVPVLFLSTTEEAFIGDDNKACMVVCRDGKAEVVKEIGTPGGEKFYCDPEEHTVTCFSRLSGERHLEVFSVKDGNLETVTTVDYYGAHHYPEEDNAEIICLQDGEEISEEDFNAVWDRYAADANEVTYEKY
ncbi:MAG: hypothetical protein ACSW8K_11435 [bacterium]